MTECNVNIDLLLYFYSIDKSVIKILECNKDFPEPFVRGEDIVNYGYHSL